MPEEVHAIIKSLSDLYVKDGKGHGDLNITLAREGQDGDVEAVTGFLVALDTEAVTLGVGGPDVRHVSVPLRGTVRIAIER